MFSHDQLVDYLNNFQGSQRESIYKSILDSNIMEQAFSTPEGKMLLNQTIDIIANNVIKIVSTCAGAAPDKASSEIYPACMEIGLAHKTLVSWAKILTNGEQHKQKIKQRKPEEKS